MTNKDELRRKFNSWSTAEEVLREVNLNGQTFLVTGGTSGIGYATVCALARKGAHVVFTGRNTKAGSEITQELQKENAGYQVDFVPLDLCSLDSVRYFAERLTAKQVPLDVLILNAGVFGVPYERTVDGYESMFQVNVLSQLYLLILLKPLLVQSASPRVVLVSSESHRMGNITFEAEQDLVHCLSPPSNSYSEFTQYNNTKWQQVLLGEMLQDYWANDGIRFYVLHPGNMVMTGLSRNWWVWRLVFGLVRPFTKSLDQGAATTIYCACCSDLANQGGQYWNNCWLSEPKRLPDAEYQRLTRALWNVYTEMLGKRIVI